MLVGNDAVPEFHAKTLPPGTAPPDRTFQPNATSETPGQADNENVLRSYGKESTYTSAESTLGGATSGDVHTGLGKPMQGQSSYEQRHESKHEGGGLLGRGASEVASGNQSADEKLDPRQRALERESGDIAGKKFSTDKGADELPNESAEAVAAERA